MSMNISTFSTEDMTAIQQAYTIGGEFDVDLLLQDIKNNDTSRVSDSIGLEDLISYYIELTKDIPPPMLESPESYAEMWQDDENIMTTLQEWRREAIDNPDLISHLENFLAQAGQDTGLISDAEAFTKDYLTQMDPSYQNPYRDSTNLVTNMVTLLMKFGDPGAALLAYVLGFDAKIHEEDIGDTEYTLENQELYADSDLPGNNVGVQGDLVESIKGTEGIETNGLYGTADTVKGDEVAYVQNIGLGEVVKDLQGTAMDMMTDSNFAWDEAIQDMANVDTSTPEGAAELEKIRMNIENIKKVLSAMQEFIKTAQETLMNVIDAASTLNRQKAQNVSTTIRNMA